MYYQEIEIPNNYALKDWLISIYEIKTQEKEISYFAIPNGYMGIMINIQGQTKIVDSNKTNPDSCIFGMIVSPFQILHAQFNWEICLLFNPVYLQLLLNDKMSHYTLGKVIDLEAILPSKGVHILKEKIYHSTGNIEKIEIIQNFLMPFFLHKKVNENVLQLYKMIESFEVFNVDQLSRHFSCTPTTIRNWAKEYLGISPKDLIQIKRFKKILTSIDIEELLDLAYNLGYYDQAHFSNFFKQKCGLTPTEYFKNNNLTFDFYNYKRWLIDNFAK